MTDFFEIKSIFSKSYFLFFRILTYKEKMDPLETSLHKAVKAGNIQDVKAFILNGVEINAKDQSNRTPLYLAVLQRFQLSTYCYKMEQILMPQTQVRIHHYIGQQHLDS